MEKNEIKVKIRGKLAELAGELGNDVSQIRDDDIIPATGLVDSAGILGLVVWYENAFDMPLTQEEINIDNLGSIESMADYVLKRKSG
jgi:acyl carrier protein